MSWFTERRLRSVGRQLTRAREDLAVADEHLLHLSDESDDARLRAIVAEGGSAGVDHSDAQRHTDAMARHRQDLVDTIARLETEQDDLLDRLSAARRPS